ncbi:helix-turn-helix domain-containing protein [Harryflintia acetispora]|uniref:helix-turn-helix domain-containing protein n=1 Tax=Harryflintia acetispora TaxID=1849041 RepID=UPI001896BA3F|nr:helix-turn-helix domain-containing protein [Harryflintia acetispora]
MDSQLKQKIDYVASVYQEITHLECHYQSLEISGSEIAQPDLCCRVCQLFRSTKQGSSSCQTQISSAVMAAIADDCWKVVVCRTGLLDWIVPVFYGGNPIGYFISGSICNSDESKKELEAQVNLFSTFYSVSPEDFEAACELVQVVQKDQVRFFARLLFDLCRIHIPPGKERPSDLKWDPSKTVFFEEEELLEEFPRDHPLSQRVYSNSFTSRAMEIFWKSIEVKANSIFANIMSKRILEAHILYDEVMSMAYCEPNLVLMRTSAETLYHIITLTRYNKDNYDIRFYRLTYETMQKLFEADSADGIKQAMDDAFDSMSYYCVVDPQAISQSPVAISVVEFLEKNYQHNIKVEDIAKSIHMSPAYVSRIFKKETNFTIKWWLNSIRMKHAQELLLETNIPIKDIGPAVGYSDMRGFYKMFAKHFGVTCSEMRKNALME